MEREGPPVSHGRAQKAIAWSERPFAFPWAFDARCRLAREPYAAMLIPRLPRPEGVTLPAAAHGRDASSRSGPLEVSVRDDGTARMGPIRLDTLGPAVELE